MNSHLNDVLIVKYRALTAGDLENHWRRMAKADQDAERRKWPRDLFFTLLCV